MIKYLSFRLSVLWECQFGPYLCSCYGSNRGLSPVESTKLGFLHPIQQAESYTDRSSALPLVGVEPTQREPCD